LLTRSRTLTRACLALAVGLAPLVAGCGSGPTDSGDTFVPGATSPSGAQGPASTAAPGDAGGRASRTTPLAERVFRVRPEPKTAAQKAAVMALQGYLDGLVTALATNDAQRSGIRRWSSPGIYADAQRIVAAQAKDGYVLYGAFVFTLEPKGATGTVAVVNACVNQHDTRRHDARTDRPGRANNTPYVQLDYTLNRREAGWVVTGYKGDTVASCPG
jgi:hypothetical protein